MKLWDKGTPTAEVIEAFTVGNDRHLDRQLARYDVAASRAHAQMLGHVGLLTTAEAEALTAALDDYAAVVERPDFAIEERFEDIHSQLEHYLTERTGDAGRKIHTGRSRNDQVLVCLHLLAKDELLGVRALTAALFDLLLELADRYADRPLPGYTHLQVAMPSSFGLWFSAYAETLADDLLLLRAAYQTADQNPLGSAAGYGSSFPLDRQHTTAALGFGTLRYNVVAAQMSRGRLEKTTAVALANVAATLNKLATDVCLYVSQNFGFLAFPDALTTGSSIMPHKKNPDVFELMRARCNRVLALPTELTLLTTNLPSGYHRDFQLLKEAWLPAFSSVQDCLRMAHYALARAEVKEGFMQEEKYRYLYSVEAVNEAVRAGMPFREAYRAVADQIADGTYRAPDRLSHTHAGSLGNLCLPEIRQKFEAAWPDPAAQR